MLAISKSQGLVGVFAARQVVEADERPRIFCDDVTSFTGRVADAGSETCRLLAILLASRMSGALTLDGVMVSVTNAATGSSDQAYCAIGTVGGEPRKEGPKGDASTDRVESKSGGGANARTGARRVAMRSDDAFVCDERAKGGRRAVSAPAEVDGADEACAAFRQLLLQIGERLLMRVEQRDYECRT